MNLSEEERLLRVQYYKEIIKALRICAQKKRQRTGIR